MKTSLKCPTKGCVSRVAVSDVRETSHRVVSFGCTWVNAWSTDCFRNRRRCAFKAALLSFRRPEISELEMPDAWLHAGGIDLRGRPWTRLRNMTKVDS